MTAFDRAWWLLKETDYPPGDPRWSEPDPRRGAPIECADCGNTFQHETEGLELPESCGVGRGMCAECWTGIVAKPENKQRAKEIDADLKIRLEGEPERVFPFEFAPGLQNIGHKDLTTGEPMVFDRAWAIVKTPVYHGTTEDKWEGIQAEGIKPSDHAPQLYERKWDEIQASLGLTDQEMEDRFGGDWSFYYGDQAENDPYHLGGESGAKIWANEWVDDSEDEGGPVVLEIDDKHPDSPFFMPEPKIDDYGFNEAKDQRRTNKVVPPHLIRRVPSEEIQGAETASDEYMGLHNRSLNWLDELVHGMVRGQYTDSDEDFEDTLAMKVRLQNWMQNSRSIGGAESYWGPKREGLPR